MLTTSRSSNIDNAHPHPSRPYLIAVDELIANGFSKIPSDVLFRYQIQMTGFDACVDLHPFAGTVAPRAAAVELPAPVEAQKATLPQLPHVIMLRTTEVQLHTLRQLHDGGAT